MSCDLCEVVGFAALVWLVIEVVVPLAQYLYKLLILSPIQPEKLGEWALVTGSTDGIGKAYACALAKKGMNILLVSRSPYKLQNVAAEIEGKYKVKVKVVSVDFSEPEADVVAAVREGIAGLEIGVLVNNVGMSYDHPADFLDIEDGEKVVRDLQAINVTSVNAMVRLVLPQMVERRRGAVINLSSMSALVPTPMLSVYAACKAYVAKLTEGLELEYRSKGITFQCVAPGFVVSNMSKIRKPTLIAPTPENFVKSALSRLGVFTVTNGFWVHDLMTAVTNTVPFWLAAKISHNQMKGTRIRALKKKEREAKSN